MLFRYLFLVFYPILWLSIGQAQIKTSLKDFAKIYGNVRFFDPAVNVEVNWNEFTIQAVRQIMETKKINADFYDSLFKPITSNTTFSSVPFKTTNMDVRFNEKPVRWQHIGIKGDNGNDIYRSIRTNFDTINITSSVKINRYNLYDELECETTLIDVKINDSLYCKIPLLVRSQSILFEKKLNSDSLFSSEINDTLIENRIATSIIIWNLIEHSYPYREKIRHWDSFLDTLLNISLSTGNFQSFYTKLRTSLTCLNDAHSQLGKTNSYKVFLPAINWLIADDKLVIKSVHDENIGLKQGDEILEYENQKIDLEIEKREQIYSAGTMSYRKYLAVFSLLKGKENSTLNILVRRNGIEKPFTVKLKRTVPFLKYYREYFEDSKSIEKLAHDSIIYLNFSKISMAQIDSMFETLKSAKSIICDFRGYPNSNHYFISYLLGCADSIKWMKIPKIIGPNYKICGYEESGWNLQANKQKHISAKIYALIDTRTISYGESIIGILEYYNLATLVGQTSAGSNGAINRFNLPCGFYFTFAGTLVQKLNGQPFDCIGFTPDIVVNYTTEGIKKKNDDIKERAIREALKQK